MKQEIARSGSGLPGHRHMNGRRPRFDRYQADKALVSTQLFDGAELERFQLKLPGEAFLARKVADCYTFILSVKGQTPTTELMKSSGIVRKAVSDVILTSFAKNARRIVIPMSPSGENIFKPIIIDLINKHGREFIPASVAWKWDFEIEFVGGPRSTPALRLPEAAPATALPAPANETFDEVEAHETAAA